MFSLERVCWWHTSPQTNSTYTTDFEGKYMCYATRSATFFDHHISLSLLSLTHYVWYMDWMHGTPFIRIYPVWNGTQKKVKASTVQVSKTIKYHCCSTVFALFWIWLFTLWFFCFRWLLQFVGINDLSTVFTECINVKFNNQINILTLKDFKFFVNLIFRWSLYPVYDLPSEKQR